MRGSIGAGGPVGAHDQLQLGRDPGIGIRGRDGVEACFWRLAEAGHGLLRRPAGDQGRGARGAQQPLGGKIVGVGVAGALPGDNANAAARAHALAGRFDQRLVDRDRGRGDRLEVEVGVIAAGGERLAQAPLEQPLGQTKSLEKVELMFGKVHRRPCSEEIHHSLILKCFPFCRAGGIGMHITVPQESATRRLLCCAAPG